MHKGTIKCVMFDLSGTILDGESKALEVVGRILSSRLGRAPNTQELELFRENPWLDILLQMFPSDGLDLYDSMIREWDRLPVKQVIHDGIEATIREIRNMGIRLAVVSSKEKNYVKMDLKEFSIDCYFDVIIGGDDTDERKPSPKPLLEAARIMGIDPGSCIYVGDQPTDMIAARRAGMRSAAALWGPGNAEYLSESVPDFMIRKPREIIGLVTGEI